MTGGYSNKYDQAEKKRQLLNDKRASTMAGRQQIDDLLSNQGRFSKQQQRGPIPEYPKAAAWTRDDTGQEPPLGIDVNAMEPVGEHFEIQESLAKHNVTNAATKSPSVGDAKGEALAPSTAPKADVETASPFPKDLPQHFEE